MIDSTHTKTAANCLITFSVRGSISLLYVNYSTNVPFFSTDSDGPVPLQLPDQWLWDILDEFIYQFQSFCVWRSKVKSKSEEELMLLADGGSTVRRAVFYYLFLLFAKRNCAYVKFIVIGLELLQRP